MTKRTYVAIGDSITWTVAATSTYPRLLSRSIRTHRSYPIQYLNKGMGGSTASEWNAVLNYMVSGIKIDLVTVALGMNDCAGISDTTTYVNSLNSVIDRLRLYNPGIEIILCAPSNTTEASRTPNIGAFRTAMQGVAVDKATFFCDFSTAWASGSTGTYCADGIHPNDAGHVLIHGVLLPVVQTTQFWLNP